MTVENARDDVSNFQKKIGMEPADGYAGVTLLARLRERS